MVTPHTLSSNRLTYGITAPNLHRFHSPEFQETLRAFLLSFKRTRIVLSFCRIKMLFPTHTPPLR